MSNKRHRDPIPLPDDSGRELDIVRENTELNPPDADVGQFESGPGLGAVVVHHTVTALLLILLVALGTWSYLTFRGTSFLDMPDAKERATFETFAVDSQVQRIRFALEVYDRLYEKYPATLETLVDEGLLQPDDVYYPPGDVRYVYQRVGNDYRLAVTREEVSDADDKG